MRWCLSICTAWGVAAFCAYAMAAEQPAADRALSGLGQVSGEKLVELLTKDETRWPAFRELRRRSKAERESMALPQEDPGSEVVVCPQGAGKPPLYAVLYEFLPHYGEPGDYAISDAVKLFGRPARQLRKKDLAIAVFRARGDEIRPFGGDNVLDGYLLDINRDGIVECVESHNYGVEGGGSATVLKVSALHEKDDLLFAVVYDWGKWDE